MNVKALLEKRNSLLDELDTIASAVETEVRGLTSEEETHSTSLQTEIESLDKAIKFAEQRKRDTAIVVDQKEDRKVEKDLQYEIRAIEQFLRKQDGEELRELRDVLIGSAPGSLTVPVNLSNLIVQKLFEVAPLFARTRNFTPISGTLEILREQDLGTAGFVGEMTNLTTSDFTMDKVRLTQKRAGTAIELSTNIINDSGIDIVNYSVNLLSRRLAMTLDRNLINGTGDANNQFEGIITNANVAKVLTAAVGTIGADDLIDLYDSMHPDYQAGGVFVMARATFNQLVKLKDGFNHYYFIRDLSEAGAMYRLLGLPVLITDAMPAAITGETPVLFANFGEAYATMIKKGLQLQHIFGDTTQALKGGHLLLLDGYFDGKVLNENAAKLLSVK